jgi:uncharacterized protein YdeI (YjbR/CyaY-like superfamily)
MDARFFPTAADFRDWLVENHDREREVWIGFYKKGSGKTGITYPEAVDEALCFGWIDGQRKSLDAISYTNRFTPRRPRSNWSDTNIKRVGELAQQGRLHPAGQQAFEAREPAPSGNYSYEATDRSLDRAYEDQFRANDDAWAFFRAQPASYQRAAKWWVMSAKQEATRLRRLSRLIDDSAQSKRLNHLSPPSQGSSG